MASRSLIQRTEPGRIEAVTHDGEETVSKVRFDISMSLDGFITGPNPRPEAPIGDDDGRLHDWLTGVADLRPEHRGADRPAAAAIVAALYDRTGALVMGRRMFDVGDPNWGENPPFGMPVFVLTHQRREPEPRLGGTTYHFVHDGIEAALARAREAAGDKDVNVQGGAEVFRQYFEAGLVDEVQIHLVPTVLGAGTRLFDDRAGGPIDLDLSDVTQAGGVAHVTMRVRP
jgi:dihydrofolate reductase